MHCSNVSALSRRGLLRVFLAALPTLGIACRRQSPDERDRVCAHVYPATLELPKPLLESEPWGPHARTEGLFDSGLPEFFLCTSRISFREVFPYFWPPLESEFQRLDASVRVIFSVPALSGAGDIASIKHHLLAASVLPGNLLVAAFTYNDFTRGLARDVFTAARAAKVAEIVVFKDPTVAPYLCEFPAVQRRFRREP